MRKKMCTEEALRLVWASPLDQTGAVVNVTSDGWMINASIGGI
jgi:hypothetical protein